MQKLALSHIAFEKPGVAQTGVLEKSVFKSAFRKNKFVALQFIKQRSVQNAVGKGSVESFSASFAPINADYFALFETHFPELRMFDRYDRTIAVDETAFMERAIRKSGELEIDAVKNSFMKIHAAEPGFFQIQIAEFAQFIIAAVFYRDSHLHLPNLRSCSQTKQISRTSSPNILLAAQAISLRLSAPILPKG